MNTSDLPISYGSRVTCRAWHDIDLGRSSHDRTEAMNQPGGFVLVRTTLNDTISGDESSCSIALATSMIRIDDTMVAQRWRPCVVDPWIDEEDHRHHPGMILVEREFSLVPTPKLTHRLPSAAAVGLLKVDRVMNRTEFRWFDADEIMPRPTDEQVRACVDSLPAPSEVDSLRREIDLMRERYLESERRVSEARGAKDDEEPWVWSDDDTANSVDGLGNMMVVRITGGHLRGLLDQRRDELYNLWLLALALVIRSAAHGARIHDETARELCTAISNCSDPRVLSATNHDGRRRSPAQVAESLFGLENARTMWEGHDG